MTTTRNTLSDLVDLWVRSMDSQGLAVNTMRNRELHLRAFMAVVGNIQTRNVERRHVDLYFERRKSGGMKANSLNSHKDSLDAFFKWAVANRHVPSDRNPMADRRRFRTTTADRLLIPASEFPRLLNCAPHPRDRIVVALGLYLFPRQSEIRTARIKDVDLERGYVHMKNHKSSSVDDMPICEELDGEIRRWLRFYAERVPLAPDYYLVPAKPTVFLPGAPDMDKRRAAQWEATLLPTRPMGAIHQAVQRAMEAAGYQTRAADGKSNFEGSHTLRRSGARALYDRLLDDGHDGAIRVVQAMLHHQSVTQTEKYLGMKLDQARRDKLLRGKRMFTAPAGNVVQLAKEA
jgi:integrase